jgi:hypothetical protein
MAAPTPSVRLAPGAGSIKLEDGYRSLIAFAANLSFFFYDLELTPPGMTVGEAIDTTTMWNTMVTKSLANLIEGMDATFVGGYDPAIYTQMQGMLGVEQVVTQSWPDGSTLAFYGGIREATFDRLVRKTMPRMTVVVTPTNWDPVNRVEALPVLTAVVGT